jgi:hypothetical protein
MGQVGVGLLVFAHQEHFCANINMLSIMGFDWCMKLVNQNSVDISLERF